MDNNLISLYSFKPHVKQEYLGSHISSRNKWMLKLHGAYHTQWKSKPESEHLLVISIQTLHFIDATLPLTLVTL